MPPRTYQTKLVCVNCGMRDFYSLPFKSEFMPFEGEHETSTGSRSLSYVRSAIQEDGDCSEFDKNCRNCGLPFLVGEYWDKSEVPELAKSTENKDTKA